MPIDDRVLGARAQAVDLEDSVRQMEVLERGNHLAHGAAVGPQNAANLVGHANLVECLNAVEDVDAILEEAGNAHSFIEGIGETLDLRPRQLTQAIGRLTQPTEDQFWGRVGRCRRDAVAGICAFRGSTALGTARSRAALLAH